MQQPPPLRQVSLSDIAHFESHPTPKILTDYDVEAWRRTTGYQDYGVFLRRLNESVVGHYLPWTSSSPSQVCRRMALSLNALDS